MFFVESSETSHICPVCHGTLHYRDSRPRTRKKEGGIKEHLMIRRFRCCDCHSYHNELPDCLVPYKHYEAEVISGVLDEVIRPEDLESEDYPSFSTMRRWIQCFIENLTRILIGRVDAPLTVVRPSQNPDVRLFRIRLFAKRIVHVIIHIL